MYCILLTSYGIIYASETSNKIRRILNIKDEQKQEYRNTKERQFHKKLKMPEYPISILDYILVYDNSNISGYCYYPGAQCEAFDWGTASGTTVFKFSFRYITTREDPGEIKVRFYVGSSAARDKSNMLAEWKVSGLKGSPDGDDYPFVHEFIIPEGKRFDLPSGTFGYSIEFDNGQTGIELAGGGSGNKNGIWVNGTGPHKCKNTNIWAGIYMKIYTINKDIGKIRIEPAELYLNSEHLHKDVISKQYKGKGVAIAIIDSGIDYTHPLLGGGDFPNGKVIGGYDFGENDYDPKPDDLAFYSGQAHGTCSAGISAGNPSNKGKYIGGIACEAKLYALKITKKSTYKGNFRELVEAIEWCIEHQYDKPNCPILVANISYGGKRSFCVCDNMNPSLTKAVDKAIRNGITVLATAGNNGWPDSLKSPACISNVISVGATDDIIDTCRGSIFNSSDKNIDRVVNLTLFSNISSFLDILAPSQKSCTIDIRGSKGYSSGDFWSGFKGTSAACSYASGTVACLQSAAKALIGRYLTPAEVKKQLIATGDYIMISKIGTTKPQVNLNRAIDKLVCKGVTFTIYNDGTGIARVSSIRAETSDQFSIWPSGPFVIKPGSYQEVCVEIKKTTNMDICEQIFVFTNEPNSDRHVVNIHATTNSDVAK